MWSPRHIISMTMPERILASVNKDAATGCWTWTRAADRDGYGHIMFKRRLRIAHRASYEAFVGPIPKGLTLDHLCQNRRCVNPAHLEPVTHAENVRRSLGPKKTHCIRGHEFTPENTVFFGVGRRACRTCKRVWRRRSHERRMSARKQVTP